MSADIRVLLPEEFPPLLQEIPDCPKQLFLRGNLPSPEQYHYLCVVGTRAASEYGRRACMSLIAGLAGMPVCIVSGLALGMDAQAHQAALATGLPTVAVLPSGATDSSIYPVTNRPLAAKILQSGGGLLTEYGGNARPQLWTFPARNRIMAGISVSTLIVEASEKSGTLITVRLAMDYNREVLVVPHQIGTERGAGGNRFLREGATLVRNSEDVLQSLGLSRPETGILSGQLPLDITEPERAVLLILTEPLTRDELIEGAGIPAQHVNIALSSLSIRGLIVERLGKIERA